MKFHPIQQSLSFHLSLNTGNERNCWSLNKGIKTLSNYLSTEDKIYVHVTFSAWNNVPNTFWKSFTLALNLFACRSLKYDFNFLLDLSQKDGEKSEKRKVKVLSCTHSYAFKFNRFHNSFLRSTCKRNFLETGFVIRNLNIHAPQQISLFLLPCFVR